MDVTETPDEYAWMQHGRCRGAKPTEFFPSDGMGVEIAQRVCDGCPVRVECLEYALLHRIEHGVWGGASERERRRILRRRRERRARAARTLRAGRSTSCATSVTGELREYAYHLNGSTTICASRSTRFSSGRDTSCREIARARPSDASPTHV